MNTQLIVFPRAAAPIGPAIRETVHVCARAQAVSLPPRQRAAARLVRGDVPTSASSAPGVTGSRQGLDLLPAAAAA
jgi:hypothetical protein